MALLDTLKASAGTGEAVRAIVTVLRSPASSTLSVDSLSNWPAKFICTSGSLLSSGAIDPSSVTVFRGHTNVSEIIIDAYAPGYTDIGNSVGQVVVVKPATYWADQLNELLSVSLANDGTLKSVVDNPGWTALPSVTVTSVTNNGNRSYSLAVNTDVTASVSPGMRLRTTRTVNAPTQSTLLNGTTQYYSKITPAGMTFTDDFVGGGWVRLSSYGVGGVISRRNGTQGWEVRVNASGQVEAVGYNASLANYSLVQSYQSVPLNKWVHVAAQLDMSAFTATTTTSYVMIDGVDVPASVSRAGTNPTALVQAGDVNVGATAAGSFFPGKIAQAFVSSAKITQANVRTLMSQGLTPALITTHSIISAYSFDNAITDLNTTNANNLTANGSAVATNADSPFGGQAGGTISSTLDYGIIAKVTASTITVNVAEGCTIPTSGGVSAISYTGVKNAYGFPGQREKWRISHIQTVQTQQTTATLNTWYNLGLGQLSIPIGEWSAGYEAQPGGAGAGTSTTATSVTLSTSSSSESSNITTTTINVGSVLQAFGTVSKQIGLSLAATTIYYLNIRSIARNGDNLYLANATGNLVIYADNAYL